jgi:hypothetical protein
VGAERSSSPISKESKLEVEDDINDAFSFDLDCIIVEPRFAVPKVRAAGNIDPVFIMMLEENIA